jgi:hypothetical protein
MQRITDFLKEKLGADKNNTLGKKTVTTKNPQRRD